MPTLRHVLDDWRVNPLGGSLLSQPLRVAEALPLHRYRVDVQLVSGGWESITTEAPTLAAAIAAHTDASTPRVDGRHVDDCPCEGSW